VTDFVSPACAAPARYTRRHDIGTYEYISRKLAQGGNWPSLHLYSWVSCYRMITGGCLSRPERYELLRMHIQASRRPCVPSSETCRGPSTTLAASHGPENREKVRSAGNGPMACRESDPARGGLRPPESSASFPGEQEVVVPAPLVVFRTTGPSYQVLPRGLAPPPTPVSGPGLGWLLLACLLVRTICCSAPRRQASAGFGVGSPWQYALTQTWVTRTTCN